MNKLQHLQYLNFRKPSRYADNITAIPAKPSLDLNFARNKSLMDNVTGNNLVTFTRSSIGTYVDSAGVLQTAVTNLLLQSEDFGTTWFLTSATLSANAIAAPNGTLTAEQLVEAATTANHEAGQAFASPVANATYTLSCYLKAATSTTCGMRFSNGLNGTGIICSVDLTAQTATVTAGTGTATIANVGSGWFRVSLTATASGTPSSTTVSIFRSIGTAGSIANSIYLWGAQLEQSSTVGEYVPTTSAINSAPRFDHRITSSVTNLLLRSEEFNNAPWASQSTPPTITANTAVSPNGTLTADTITFASADSRLQSDTISFTAGVAYTFSIYAKAVGTSLNRFRLAFFDGAQQNSADFTVSNLTWTRITATFIAANAAAGRVQIRNATDVLANSLFFWGAQLEAGSVATLYIPTTAAAATSNTTESLGLLVEEPRINLLTRSEEFETTWAALNSSVSANTTVAPDGTLTADKIVENSTTNVHGVSRGGGSETVTNGTVYTFSVFAKAAERGFIWMQALNGFVKSYFNLSTGVVSASGAGHTSTITPAGNGWYRCAITFTSDQPNNSYRAIGMAQVSGTESYTGNGTSGLFLWGAQLEAGATVSSYILNVNTPLGVTRNADVAQITGTNFGVTRTNLLLRSEELNDAAWTTLALNATVSANQTTAPNGATTADSIADDAVNNVHYIGQSVAVAAATTYTFSCFLRAGTSNFGYLSLSGGGPGWGDTFVVNLSTGVGNVQAGSFGSTSIQAFANGWYRVVVTKITTGAGSPQLRVGVAQSLSVTSYSGSGSTIFAWGAQLETGTAATAYIPTTTTTASVFDSWYRQDEGTWFGDTFREFAVPAGQFPVIVDCRTSGGSANINQFSYVIESIAGSYVAVGGVVQSELYPTVPGGTRRRRIASAYAANNFAACVNGFTPLTDSTGSVGNVPSMGIGSVTGTGQYLNGHIRRLTYWKTRLPNANLQRITQ